MPPWPAAREAAEVVVGFAVTVAVTTEVMMLAMMMIRRESVKEPLTTVSQRAKI